MELQFTEKENGMFVAYATINDNVAIHAERENDGFFYVNMRSTDHGEYAPDLKSPANVGDIVDTEVVCNKYPKYLEIISTSKVLWAEIVE